MWFNGIAVSWFWKSLYYLILFSKQTFSPRTQETWFRDNFQGIYLSWEPQKRGANFLYTTNLGLVEMREIQKQQRPVVFKSDKL